MAIGNPQQWQARLARVALLEQQLDGALRAADAHVGTRRGQAAMAFADRVGAAHGRALTRLMLTPAPDLAAASAKLALAMRWGLPVADLAGLQQDLKRLG